VTVGPSPPGPSDVGLAGERTALAWSRLAMALLALPTGLFGYSSARGSVPALVLAAAAAASGLVLLVVSLRRPRTPAAMLTAQQSVLAARQVVLAAVTVVLVALATLALVLQG
jgi:uncharacterized membrane protein YidH (DUF202 family)